MSCQDDNCRMHNKRPIKLLVKYLVLIDMYLIKSQVKTAVVVNNGEGPEYVAADSRRRREVGNEEEIPTSTTPKPPRESGSGRKVIKLVPKPRFLFTKYSIQGYFASCYFRSFSLANGFAPPLIHQDKVLNKER